MPTTVFKAHRPLLPHINFSKSCHCTQCILSCLIAVQRVSYTKSCIRNIESCPSWAPAVQDEKHPSAEDAASAFQQLKADLPHLFLECTQLKACLPSVSHLSRFSTGPDQAHLHAPSSYDIVSSIDSNDCAGLVYTTSQALQSGRTTSLTSSEENFCAWQPDPMAFASWSQKLISHKAIFKAACQVKLCSADALAHHNSVLRPGRMSVLLMHMSHQHGQQGCH